MDEADLLNFVYEAKSELSFLFLCSLNYLFFNVVYSMLKFVFYVDSDRMTK